MPDIPNGKLLFANNDPSLTRKYINRIDLYRIFCGIVVQAHRNNANSIETRWNCHVKKCIFSHLSMEKILLYKTPKVISLQTTVKEQQSSTKCETIYFLALVLLMINAIRKILALWIWLRQLLCYDCRFEWKVSRIRTTVCERKITGNPSESHFYVVDFSLWDRVMKCLLLQNWNWMEL